MVNQLLKSEEVAAVEAAIQEAESKTSGEIRIHLAEKSDRPVYDAAATVFGKLGMSRTADRNGILIYLAVKDCEFAVLGDIGIHNKVSPDFWNDIGSAMAGHFAKGEFASGLIEAVKQCGEQLAIYFPRKSDDQNELPDKISTQMGS